MRGSRFHGYHISGGNCFSPYTIYDRAALSLNHRPDFVPSLVAVIIHFVPGIQGHLDKMNIRLIGVLTQPLDPGILVHEAGEMMPVGMATMPTPRKAMKIPKSLPMAVMG